MSVECYFGPAFARLTMTGPLTPAMVLDMRRQFRTAVEYYRYSLVEIEIDSPGGDAGALRALSIEMEWLRANGCAIRSTGMMQACSAAALTLAMGTVGMRSVQPYTQLLFHNSRATPQGEYPLTAIHAIAAAGQLQRLDAQVVEMVVDHLTRARGGLCGLATVGLNRCQKLQHEAATGAPELGSDADTASKFRQKSKPKVATPAWFKPVIAAYQQVLKSDNSKAFIALLASVFAQDAQMAHEMGWCLQLIDHVEGSSLMRPEVESEQVQVVEPANSATMRLAA